MVQPHRPPSKLHGLGPALVATLLAFSGVGYAQSPAGDEKTPAEEGAGTAASPPAEEVTEPAADAGPEGGSEVVVAEAKENAGPRRIVWILTLPPEEEAAAAPGVLAKILEGSPDTHIITSGGAELSAWLAENSVPLPPCLSGLAPCSNVRAEVLKAIGSDLLVRGELTRTGPRWSFAVSLFGADGRVAVSSVYQAGGVPVEGQARTVEQDLDALMADAARGLFAATGTVRVETTPEGASISIDGKEVGVSPVTTEVPVGQHQIAATLTNHMQATAMANVVAGRRTSVEMTLEPRLATLTVDSTPVLGDLYIDNVKRGTAGTPIQLPPGEYELELRAEGYRNRTVHLVLSPEEMKVMSLQLDATRPRLPVAGLGEVSTDAIIARRYFLRVAYRHGSLASGLSNAEGAFNGESFRLGDLLVDGAATPEAKAELGYHGILLEAGYHWSEHWGFTAAGLSVFSSSDNARGQLIYNDAPRNVRLEEFERVEFKPAQLIFRYPYKNLFPQIQTGFAYFTESFRAEFDGAAPSGLANTVELDRSGFLFHFSIEASYFFDTWWFGYATLGIERDMSHDDTDTETIVGFGVGLTLENPLQDSGFVEPPREVAP